MLSLWGEEEAKVMMLQANAMTFVMYDVIRVAPRTTSITAFQLGMAAFVPAGYGPEKDSNQRTQIGR